MQKGSDWPTGGHAFIDESKRHSYLLVASVIVPNDLEMTRRAVRALKHSGARRIHMKAEGDSSRKKIISGLSKLEISCHIVGIASYSSELEARAACLKQVLDGCELHHAASLTIERDESLQRWERQFLLTQQRDRSLAAEFTYDWKNPTEEPLLWIPDVVAWAYAKGGDWRRRISDAGLVTSVTSL
ncbi:hypothetical protein [Actinomyces provencensis]|uniref:hypothetical protein n=1 Tax=Actinomyces provencensis TaxID=1720198 RepID=UPI00096A685D|nr:hypothetical protein [Actinomyces provencensis]